MSDETLELILPYLDAINVDLKGDARFYKEIVGNANQSRTIPIDRLCGLHVQFALHQQFEITFMVNQPVQIKQPLVDHVLIRRTLVLDDYGRIVLVDAQRVHPAVGDAILGGEKTYAQ